MTAGKKFFIFLSGMFLFFNACVGGSSRNGNVQTDTTVKSIAAALRDFDYNTGSEKRNIPDNTPQSIIEIMRNAPETSITGLGYARLSSANMSKTIAETRARDDINKQLKASVTAYMKQYPAAAELYLSALLSNLALLDTSLTASEFDADNGFWALIEMPRTSIQKSVNQAILATEK
jgi:hypothetical protein